MHKISSILSAILFLALCTATVFPIMDLPSNMMVGMDIGVAFFPAVCIALIALLSVLLIVREWFFHGHGEDASRVEPRNIARIGLIVVLVVIYAFMFEPVGFYLTSLGIGMLWLLAVGELRPLVVIGYPVGAIVVIHIAFVKILGTLLPVGPLTFL